MFGKRNSLDTSYKFVQTCESELDDRIPTFKFTFNQYQECPVLAKHIRWISITEIYSLRYHNAFMGGKYLPFWNYIWVNDFKVVIYIFKTHYAQIIGKSAFFATPCDEALQQNLNTNGKSIKIILDNVKMSNSLLHNQYTAIR